MLAILATDFAHNSYTPLATTDGLATYIHKGAPKPTTHPDHFRGIRCTSAPGKLVCRLMADPILPVDATYKSAVNPEQFAGRQAHSAEMLAVIVSIILALMGTRAFFLVLLDIRKAFDTLWRNALWAKLIHRGGPLRVIAWLRAVYARVRTAVRSGHDISDLHDLTKGIGQGDTNSTDFYGIFLSDLPDIFRQAGVGTQILQLHIACLDQWQSPSDES